MIERPRPDEVPPGIHICVILVDGSKEEKKGKDGWW